MSNPELEATPPDRPDWLDTRFTSVEDQARSYNEARAEMGRAQARAQEVEQAAQYYMERASELEAALEAQPQEQQIQDDPAAFNPLVAQYEQAVENGDIRTQMALTAYMASQISDQKNEALKAELLQAVGQKDPVANEYYAMQAHDIAREAYDAKYGQGAWDVDKVEAAQWLATEAPERIPETLSPSQAAKEMIWAAEHVQGLKHLTADEQQRTQMAAQRQQRLMAQTARGSGTPPPAVETDEERWAQIANAPKDSYSSLRRSG